MLAVDDGLLDCGLVALEFNELLLEVVVFLALEGDLVGEVLEVGHYERVEHLHILVVLRRQVVLHKADLLPQQVNFLLVVAQHAHALLDVLLHPASCNC